MSNVAPFRNYQLAHIPNALRLMAEKVEAGSLEAKHVLVVFQRVDGTADYCAFGDDFNKAHAIGLLEVAKHQVLGTIE